MRRGEIWVANLNPNKGAKIGKIRPVLVLQADPVSRTELSTVVVVPLTSQLRSDVEPMRVHLKARDRLRKDCHVMVEHIRALDRHRIGDGPLASLTREEMAAVERSLKAILGMY